jgi:hypothetical protein
VSGFALLIASVAAGALWDAMGAPVPFATGACLAGVSLLLLRFAGPGRASRPM